MSAMLLWANFKVLLKVKEQTKMKYDLNTGAKMIFKLKKIMTNYILIMIGNN